MSWGVHVNWILSDSCSIGCCSHCFCIKDDSSNQPSSLDMETPGILGDESFLEDSLPGMTEASWVEGGGNLWRGKSSRDQLV